MANITQEKNSTFLLMSSKGGTKRGLAETMAPKKFLVSSSTTQQKSFRRNKLKTRKKEIFKKITKNRSPYQFCGR